MKLSLMAIVAITMIFVAGTTSAILVALHAPVGPFSYDSSSLVVIYISDKWNISVYQRTCPAPVAAVNTTEKTLISLKTPAGCAVSLHVGVHTLDGWSEARRGIWVARIVSRIRGNRADFQAFKYTPDAQNHTVESVITLRLTRLGTELNHCSVVDLILPAHHLWFDKTTQPYEFSWSTTVFILFLMSILALVHYSTWYFIQLRPTIYDYLDPYELERLRFEYDAADEE